MLFMDGPQPKKAPISNMFYKNSPPQNFFEGLWSCFCSCSYFLALGEIAETLIHCGQIDLIKILTKFDQNTSFNTVSIHLIY